MIRRGVLFHKHSNEQHSHLNAFESYGSNIAAASQSTVEVKVATVAFLCLLYLS